VAVSIPKRRWEVITAEDLENARPRIEPGDIVMAFPWRWTEGDGSGVRVVAVLDPAGEYRIETLNS
jgi:kynurenine formamidase